MSVQYVTAMLAQFDTNIALVTNEAANPLGGGFKASGYRFSADKEPDSAAEGLYYLDVPRVAPKERYWGTGENIWVGTVTLQLGYYRGGGDAGGVDGGDRRSVAVRANDDCMRVSDVCENPANYNRDTTGIRWVKYTGHRRAFDLKKYEVWEVDFDVEWRSDLATTNVVSAASGGVMLTASSTTALTATGTSLLSVGQQALVTSSDGQAYVLHAPVASVPDGSYVLASDDANLQWVSLALLSRNVVFVSDEIDLMVGSVGGAFGGNLPTFLSGKRLFPLAAKFVYTQQTPGAAWTQAPAIQVGSNGTANNVITGTTLGTTAQLTAMSTPGSGAPESITINIAGISVNNIFDLSNGMPWFVGTPALSSSGVAPTIYLKGRVCIGGLLTDYPVMLP